MLGLRNPLERLGLVHLFEGVEGLQEGPWVFRARCNFGGAFIDLVRVWDFADFLKLEASVAVEPGRDSHSEEIRVLGGTFNI